MKRIAALLIVGCLLLTGCSSWLDGSYSAIKPHVEYGQTENTAIPVYGYDELTAALISMVENGVESGILSMQYDEETARTDMEKAIWEVRRTHSFAAYAVENIEYDFGASGGRKAMSVKITYWRNRVRMDQIQRAATIEQVQQIIAQRLNACDAGVVLYFESQTQPDYAQLVADYALEFPQRVIETPEVTVNFYPEQGEKQIVELKFSYQTSRAQLRALQNKVAPVFVSAAEHVNGDWTAEEKAARLYAFLMERYEYSIQTSITPAYSLLLHGVGDNRAFAMVYGAMCRQADVDCYMVTGTRQNTPWVWNAVRIGDVYYYIDLLNSAETGFRLWTQEEMADYVWDYSEYSVSEDENL